MYFFKKALLLGLTLLLGACVNLQQPSNSIQYYTLEYDPPVFTGMDQLPYVISVERFSVSPIYDTTQIIYRKQSFTRDAYVYHRWRVNPGEIITHFLNRDIRDSGLFMAVISSDSAFKSSFSLSGQVEEFLELDTEERWNAVISLSVSLMAENKQEINNSVIFF